MLKTSWRKGGVPDTYLDMGCPGQASVDRCHLSRDSEDERDEPRKGCKGVGGGGWAGTNIVKRRNSICKNPEADHLVYLPKMEDDPSG